MIQIDLTGKNALITGGTKGIGLSGALHLAEAGAQIYLTYKWGSADERELRDRFEAVGGKQPVLIQADASVDEDTDRLMEDIGKTADSVDIFINNVGFAARTMSLEEYKKRSLFKSLEYSSWPIVEYSRKINKAFGKYPEYILGISSDGPDHFYRGYDFVAASKAMLEFLAKYLAAHLADGGSRVNIIRFGSVGTESFNQIFGDEFFNFMKSEGVSESLLLSTEDCGKAILAFCSGLLYAVNGQIIHVDNGLPFRDNTMMRFLASQGEKSS